MLNISFSNLFLGGKMSYKHVQNDNLFIKRAKKLVDKMTLAEKLSQMNYEAPAIPRLGVPGYNWWNECLHGVARSGKATVFPQAIGMAASFNDELMKNVADAISTEARAKYNQFRTLGDTQMSEGLTYWSPNINIFRDPRWGRGQETYGEDPLLTAKMGIAFIKGLQGEGKYRKVDATIKHYAVHSGPEDDRHGFDVKIDDKELYETYLYAFEQCIKKASPSAVMGAYNAINGEPCCASPTYVKDVLYKEFGFDGYFVSDCGAICDLDEAFHITNNKAESAALAVNSGCNLNCGSAYQYLKVAVAQGLIDEETINDAVTRLFTARLRLGMFDNDCEYDSISYDVVESKKHREINLKMAHESIVLLKNNGLLPLKPNQKIAVIGPNADDKTILLGNYNGTPSRYTMLLQGLIEEGERRGCTVDYARGSHLFQEKPGIWEEHPLRDAILSAKRADVIVMCMGISPLLEGEEVDDYSLSTSSDKQDLELPSIQKELFEEILNVGKPIVFVNVSGSAINLKHQDENCDAVLQCFYLGAEGGKALADIIFGNVSPSGRLPVTFYETIDDLPEFKDYTMKNRTYKFYEGTPVYSFGHGLNYSEIQEIWHDDSTVELENKGPFDTAYSVLKFETNPHKKLVDFKKVFLHSGEKKKIIF